MKKRKRPDCPSVDRIACKIAECQRKGDKYFCVQIPDDEVDIARRYFATIGVDIQLEYQHDGLFFYKVSNY